MPNKWSELISNFLNKIDWPREEEKLTEKENHIFESWKNCLDQLASLNSILERIDRIEAINNLNSILLLFATYLKHRVNVILNQ